MVGSIRCGRGWSGIVRGMWLRREEGRGGLGAAAMYAVLTSVVAAFFLTYFNRFSALRSGNGEYTAGVAFLAGQMPYRDYFTTAPPLNLLKSALLLKVFGTALIVSRGAGVVERMLIAAVLFGWLRRVVRPVPALVASAVTVVLSAGDRTDPIASYNHDAILWAMLSGLLASSVLRRGSPGGKGLMLLSMLSGVCAGLSVLTKQTVGLGSACTVLAVVGTLLSLREDAGRAGMWAAAFLGGCGVPVAAVALVLARMHLLSACLEMLFVKGPAAKAAHVSDFLVRELRVGWDNFGWVTLGSFALLLGWRAMARAAEGRGEGCSDADMPGDQKSVRVGGYVFLAGAGVLGLAEVLRGLPALHDFSKSAVYFTFLGMTLLLVRYGVRLRSRATDDRRAQCVLLCAVSWSVALTLSLSWPAFEAMLLPGLGVLVALVLDGARRRALPLVYAALAFVSLMQVREKLDLPFGFDYQDEAPVRSATFASVQPQLRGLRLPWETVRFLDETVATIDARTRPGERIFVYPEMGLLYALSGRGYPTVSGSHNIDVLNDSFAAAEADRLRLARPAVIVYYRETEQQQKDAERLWRGGRPSGQRALVAAVEELVGEYRLSGTYRLSVGDPEILVFVRP